MRTVLSLCSLIIAAALVPGARAATQTPAPAVFDIRTFGAKAGGEALQTAAIQRAIDACAAQGGGTVVVPPGVYTIGTLRMRSAVTLRVERGAVLQGSHHLADYADDVRRAIEAPAFNKCLIYAEGAHGIRFEGEGLIDGRGSQQVFPVKVGDGLGERPMLMRLVNCTDVSFAGLSFRNPGSWGLHLLQCRHVHFDAISIQSKDNNWNNDGIDLDTCSHVLVENCRIESGDDAICPKSTLAQPCSDIVVRHCDLSSNTAGFKLGSSSRGGFVDITVVDTRFHDCPMGAVKLTLVDGGRMENIGLSRLTMRNVGGPFFIRLGNRGRSYDRPTEQVYSHEVKPEGVPVGAIRGITISDVTAEVSGPELDRQAIFITGIPGARVENVTLRHVRVRFTGAAVKEAAPRVVPEDVARYPEQWFFGLLPAWGLYARHVEGLVLDDVQLDRAAEDARKPIVVEDGSGVAMHGVACNGRKFTEDELGGRKHLATGEPLRLFVAPQGNDANPATVAAPLASLEGARDRIRQIKAKGPLPAGGVRVELAAGDYVLERTVAFDDRDSGTAEAPIVYAAAAGATPRIYGGRRLPLASFAAVDDSAVVRRLAPAARGHVVCISTDALHLGHAGPFPPVFEDNGGIFELFWNGARLPLSRWPNEGWTTMKRAVRNGDAKTPGVFEYRDDEPARWTENPMVWLQGQWRVAWEQPSVRVAAIDPAQHTITFAAGIPNGIGNKYTRPAGNGKEPWCAINLLEEIDRPGEWAIDFATQRLYLWPPAPPGELIVSQLAGPMIEAQGTAHLTFAGLTFEESLGDGIVLHAAESDVVAGCTLRNLAHRGVVIDGYRSGVVSCDMYNLGWGCVYIAGGDKRRLIPSEDFVLNNNLHDYAVLKPMYSPAVDVGFGGAENGVAVTAAVGIRVAHNLIHDAPRDAVLVSGEDNVFEYNDISHCGFGSGDVGAFYSWLDWTIRGVVIRYNFIHDTVGGVNPDDGASGNEVYGNVFMGPRTGVWIASGADHRTEHNIFVKDEGPVFGIDDRGVARGYATNSKLFKAVAAVHPNESPWAERFPQLAAQLAHRPELPWGTTFSGNVVVIQRGAVVQNKMSAATQKLPGLLTVENNFVTAGDPGFVNAAGGDYALRTDSVVFQKIPGFLPIPFEQIGLYRDEYRTTLPVRSAAGTAPNSAKDAEHAFGT